MSRDLFYTILLCLLIPVVTLPVQSCKKEKADKVFEPADTDSFDVNRIWNCHDKKNPYPSQITANITGTWVWQSYTCYWNGGTTKTADKHVIVTFNDGGLFKMYRDGKLETEGTWSLSAVGKDWSIVTKPSCEYLHGFVLLCDDELITYSSYIDGCDHYFLKR